MFLPSLERGHRGTVEANILLKTFSRDMFVTVPSAYPRGSDCRNKPSLTGQRKMFCEKTSQLFLLIFLRNFLRKKFAACEIGM